MIRIDKDNLQSLLIQREMFLAAHATLSDEDATSEKLIAAISDVDVEIVKFTKSYTLPKLNS